MFGDTELWFVDDASSLAKTARELAKAPVIGVDTESDSFHHYQEKVCLIQFSDLERDYIVDPLSIPDLTPLEGIFANREQVKIFHGADYDILCMKRDFGFEIHNIFDTMIASQMAGQPRFGLADLIESFFGHHIDKQYQRHDWAKRPLRDEHIQYARGDTHFLLAIREILIRRLRQVGRLGHVREECRILERKKWEPREADPHKWLKTKKSQHLEPKALRVLRALWQYRDDQARRSDRPPFKVLPDFVLVRVAERQPTSEQELDKLFKGKTSMKKRYGRGMIQAVERGLADERPIPKPKRKKRKVRKGPPSRLTGQAAEAAMAELKRWRNEMTKRDALYTPITTASNATLKEIARVRPTTLEELAAIPDVRKWQVSDYGEEILEILDTHCPWPPKDAGEPKLAKKKKKKKKKSVS
ncbi:MAG: ribonuclease D [Deltaproteobacteria bacterium]|nr:MAG: ribonuclease D [Deltaproteobacteria bacterium]